MEEKQKGGKRVGSGRKPLPDKKKPLTIYVSPAKIELNGGEDKLRGKIYELVENDFMVNPISERNYENRIENLAKGNSIDMGNLDPHLEKTKLKFHKSAHKKAKKVLKSKIDYQKATPESYDAEKQSNIKNDELGQYQSQPISRETWGHTDPSLPPRLEGESSIDYRIRISENK